MSIRDSLNRNAAISGVAIVATMLLAGYFIYAAFRNPIPTRSDKDFYTVDEGQTCFTDKASRVPPFDYKGKEAVRVRYFTCDGGKTRFVGWLEQWSPAAKAVLESAQRDGKGNLKDPTIMHPLGWDSDPMVKRPGDPRWFKRHEKEYEEITSPKCPEGGDENLLAPVEP